MVRTPSPVAPADHLLNGRFCGMSEQSDMQPTLMVVFHEVGQEASP